KVGHIPREFFLCSDGGFLALGTDVIVVKIVFIVEHQNTCFRIGAPSAHELQSVPHAGGAGRQGRAQLQAFSPCDVSNSVRATLRSNIDLQRSTSGQLDLAAGNRWDVLVMKGANDDSDGP